MVLTNLGDDAFPFGAGFHPFFSVQQDTLVEFPAIGFWFEDKQNLPDRFVRQIPSDYNFNSEKTVPDLWINNGYQMSDSGVRAMLRHKNGVSVLVSSPCRYLQVYKPSGESNFLCLEPQSHYVDAHNFGCESLSVLSPQESMQISMCIRVVT
jgi:aldose 1-epimerase